MGKSILVLNAGSSSLKFCVFELAGTALAALASGQIEGLGTAPHLIAKDHSGTRIADQRWDRAEVANHVHALQQLAEWLRIRFGGVELAAVGHRVVHGGADYAVPTQVTPEALARLEKLVPLAPLHQPHNLAAIRAVSVARPELPQVACFDTAFHRSHAQVVELFGLPYEYYERGVRRYGFHGLSYEYVASALPEVAPAIARGKIVIAHLGSGASMCAIRDGRSVASTMGFTALDGLVMGTRSGSLDAGVVLYLLQQEGMDAKQIEDLLYKRSGLLGLSGLSNDMRPLLDSDDPRARLAVDYFVHRASRELGSLAAALDGLDALVFTAGIGENSAEIRRRICAAAQWLGIALDPQANAAGGPCISQADCRTSAWVVPTNEELMIARHTRAVLGL
jgi:acetate kinase